MKIEAFINGIPIEEIPEEEKTKLIKKMLQKAAASIGMSYTKDVETENRYKEENK